MTDQLAGCISRFFSWASLDDEARTTVFAENALAVDEGKVYRGLEEITKWRAGSIAAKVTYTNRRVDQRGGDTCVTAEINGTFDRTGLPDPLDLDFHFVLSGDRIVLLAIVLSKKAKA